MIRVNMVVEGQAEETFVQECLARHLAGFNVAVTPRRVEFGRKKGRIARGGLLDYAKLRKDILNWLNQEKAARVTTMVDLYALPSNFPGRAEGAKLRAPHERAAFLEQAFAADIASNHFLPHIQLHEFEAMLFSDIARLANYYPAHTDGIQTLAQEATGFANPELINEGQTTAPSKRILREVPPYDKIVAGSLLALDLGLPLIRRRCPHFDAWTTKLEQLGQVSP